MRKVDLVKKMIALQKSLSPNDIALSVEHILSYLSHALIEKKRIEIRGFGNLTPHNQAPREVKNPKTNEKIQVPKKHRVRFKMGKTLKKQINEIRL